MKIKHLIASTLLSFGLITPVSALDTTSSYRYGIQMGMFLCEGINAGFITSLEDKNYPLIISAFHSTLSSEDQDNFKELLDQWTTEKKSSGDITGENTKAYNSGLNLYLFRNCLTEWSTVNNKK